MTSFPEGSGGDAYSPVPDGDLLMGKAPAFQFYAADFNEGTSFMSACEVGIYIRLLSSSWSIGPLPASMAKMASIARVTEQVFTEAWENEVGRKWILTTEGYINERLEAQRAEYEAFVEKQAAKGRKGAQRRWDDGSGHAPANATAIPPAMAQAMPRQWPDDGSSSSSSSSKEREEIARVVQNPHSKPTNLINGAEQRRHGTHAWCAPDRPSLCVTTYAHDIHVDRLGGDADAARKRLRKEIYPKAIEALGDQPAPDALKFWTGVIDAHLKPQLSKPDTRGPHVPDEAATRAYLDSIHGTRQ